MLGCSLGVDDGTPLGHTEGRMLGILLGQFEG